MNTINNLIDLLAHQIQNLYAAEEQIKQAMPAIIEKAHHSSLKNALQHHLQLTGEQQNRLQQVMKLLSDKAPNQTELKLSPSTNCKGIAGLLDEANEVLNSPLAPDVNDAAIITYVQKMEHYEISTYGTAHAFAAQMHLHEAEALLTETLNEEYDADDLLTALATAALNKEAIPEGLVTEAENTEGLESMPAEQIDRPSKVSISERTVNSPGGRAGTSHRRYGSGESRGH